MAYDLRASLSINAAQFNSGMKSAAKQMKSMSSGVADANRQMSSMSSTMKKVGGAIAGYIAVDSIKNLGISMVEAAANAQAVGAQFEQTFGDMEGAAENAVAKLGKEFGMLPDRLKGNMAQVTSQFKGLGLGTKDAMKQASRSITVAADSAAYYDTSMENASSAINSFLKGNYEAGESVGLFASESQMAKYASDELGISWKNATEAQKQMTRLDFAENMQKSSGAMGQAARESQSYENQLGNLKQSWTTFSAELAKPVLPIVIAGFQKLSGWISRIDTGAIISGFQTFGTYLSDTFSPILDSFKTVAEGAWGAFKDMGGVDLAKEALEGIKSGLAWLSDNSTVVVSAITGIGAAIGTLKVISTVNAGIAAAKALWTLYTTSAFAATVAQHGLNAALIANPVGLVVTAIGLLVAAGIALYLNFDKVKAKAKELWSALKEVFGKIANWTSEKLAPVASFFSDLKDKFDGFKDSITSFSMPGWVSSIGDTIGGAVSKAKGLFGGGKSHAGGLSYVPSNGYQAVLHKGERVLTPEENKAYSRGEGMGGGISVGNIVINGVTDIEGAADKLISILAQKVEQAGGAGA